MCIKIKKMVVGSVLFFLACTLFFLGCKTWKAAGRSPRGERLKKLEQLPYFVDGKVQNLEYTTTLAPGEKNNLLRNVWNFLFKSYPNVSPRESLPVVKTDLKSLDLRQDLYVWLGHSTVLLQLDGKRYLFDPVLTYQIPASIVMKPFKGTAVYYPNDLPDIDYLVITHDHWDHLDYGTVKALRPRVANVICGLGIGEHFEYWGYEPSKIHELVWNDSLRLTPDTYIHCLPARHFSGRLFSHNTTLWSQYLIDGKKRIFVSGDGGYGSHFATVGQRFPNIDLAFMENGQYNTKWRLIHLLPHLLVKAIGDLAPKRVMTYHNSKFRLAHHPWYEPLDSISINSEGKPWELLTPRIGEIVYLDQEQNFTKWWEALK